MHTMAVTHHLYAYDQFLGFSGSSGPSHVTNSLVPSVLNAPTETDTAMSLWVLSSLVTLDSGSSEAMLAGLSTVLPVGECSSFMQQYRGASPVTQ